MKNIINNLCQLISLRIFAILGYIVPIAVLCFCIISTMANGENDKTFFGIIFLFFIGVYWGFVLKLKVNVILIVIMFFEYNIRKSMFKENDAFNPKHVFFIIGVILNIICFLVLTYLDKIVSP